MYWLGYLADRKKAGELDWRAIGGTWGSATSNLTRWRPDPATPVPYDGFEGIIGRISEQSSVLGRYVHKYFEDMTLHTRALATVVAPGGRIHYVVGNSKFFDVVIPVEAIFEALFVSAGFADTSIRVLRKRTSKKELYEFLVSAEKPKPQRVRAARRR
jgi:hypothetical protein